MQRLQLGNTNYTPIQDAIVMESLFTVLSLDHGNDEPRSYVYTPSVYFGGC